MVISVVLAIVAGLAKAIQDVCGESSFYKSRLVKDFNFNPKWWHRSEASSNKWKNGDKSQGEAFWGSSRWFVFLTDGWHLMDAVRNISIVLAVFMTNNVFGLLIVFLVFLGIFETIYKLIKI